MSRIDELLRIKGSVQSELQNLGNSIKYSIKAFAFFGLPTGLNQKQIILKTFFNRFKVLGFEFGNKKQCRNITYDNTKVFVG